MLVDAELDDIVLSDAYTGLQANMLRPSIVAAGLNPAALLRGLGAQGAAALYGAGAAGLQRWKDG